jgi:hypothetical protein
MFVPKHLQKMTWTDRDPLWLCEFCVARFASSD